jgi:hypothetical protein
MLRVGLHRPNAGEEAELHRPSIVYGDNNARLDDRRPPGRKRGVHRGVRNGRVVLDHQHHARRRFEAEGQIRVPFVRRAAGAQAIAEFAVEKGGRRVDDEVVAGEQARLPRSAGVARLGGSGAVSGTRHEQRRLAGKNPVPGRPEFCPQANVRVVEARIDVGRRRAQRVAFERRLAEDGQFVGDPVFDVGLRVLAVLLNRRIVAPGRARPDPAEERLDEKSASLRLRPGAGPRGHRRGEHDRKRDRGASSTLNPAAGGDHVAPPERKNA